MGRALVRRYQVGLEVSQLKDGELHALVAGIQQAASTSELIQSRPAMQACLALLGTRDAELTEAGDAVVDARAKLRTCLAAEAQCRSAAAGELRTFASMTMTYARSAADIQGAGLPPRAPTPGKKLPPEAPERIDTHIPVRGHGKATVSVHETGKVRRQYVAEQSFDPVTPGSWAPLGVGRGKTRTVTGASGTRVWVRFATVRGELQSPWSTPVLITIP